MELSNTEYHILDDKEMEVAKLKEKIAKMEEFSNYQEYKIKSLQEFSKHQQEKIVKLEEFANYLWLKG